MFHAKAQGAKKVARIVRARAALDLVRRDAVALPIVYEQIDLKGAFDIAAVFNIGCERCCWVFHVRPSDRVRGSRD